MLSHQTIISLCAALLLISPSNIFGEKNSPLQNSTSYRLPGLIATVPNDIGLVVRNFSKGLQNRLAPTSPDLRRVILHGSYGVGKTDIIRAIAEKTGSTLIELKGSAIVDRYQGSGSTKIQETFNAIKQKLDDGAESVVLFIDEIDALASTDTPDHYRDMQGALRELCCLILDYESERRVLVACATNDISNIEPRLLNRCTKIEIPLPNELQRADILQGTHHNYHKPPLAIHELTSLANKIAKSRLTTTSETSPATNIEVSKQLAATYTSFQKKMVTFDKEVMTTNVVAKNQDEHASILSKAESLIRESAELSDSANPTQPNSTLAKSATDHRNISLEYLTAVKQYLIQPAQAINPELLKQLVKETEGMPPRSLIGFIRRINAIAYDSNNGIISPEIIQEELKRAKEAFACEIKEANKKLAKKQDQEEELAHKARIRADYTEEQKMRLSAHKTDMILKSKNYGQSLNQAYDWNPFASSKEKEKLWKDFCNAADSKCLFCQRNSKQK